MVSNHGQNDNLTRMQQLEKHYNVTRYSGGLSAVAFVILFGLELSGIFTPDGFLLLGIRILELSLIFAVLATLGLFAILLPSDDTVTFSDEDQEDKKESFKDPVPSPQSVLLAIVIIIGILIAFTVLEWFNLMPDNSLIVWLAVVIAGIQISIHTNAYNRQVQRLKHEQSSPPQLPKLLQSIIDQQGGTDENVQKLFEHTVKHIQDRRDWYNKNASPKKQAAVSVRRTALLLLGLGAVIPIIIDINVALLGNPAIPASVASLVLALGSGLIVFDRFMGYSSAWMRYRSTEMVLGSKLSTFAYDWRMSEEDPENISTKNYEKIKLLRDFLVDIENIVNEETRMWVDEFQQSLSQLDEKFRNNLEKFNKLVAEVNERKRTYFLIVAVKGAGEKPWTIVIDDKKDKAIIARENQVQKVISNLQAGEHKVEIAIEGGKVFEDRVVIGEGHENKLSFDFT